VPKRSDHERFLQLTYRQGIIRKEEILDPARQGKKGNIKIKPMGKNEPIRGGKGRAETTEKAYSKPIIGMVKQS
jgi:hypothetical protein